MEKIYAREYVHYLRQVGYVKAVYQYKNYTNSFYYKDESELKITNVTLNRYNKIIVNFKNGCTAKIDVDPYDETVKSLFVFYWDSYVDDAKHKISIQWQYTFPRPKF